MSCRLKYQWLPKFFLRLTPLTVNNLNPCRIAGLYSTNTKPLILLASIFRQLLSLKFWSPGMHQRLKKEVCLKNKISILRPKAFDSSTVLFLANIIEVEYLLKFINSISQ